MKLILTHDVADLGSVGDVVTVKDGYGRNFLLPRGYATPWTKGGQKQVDQLADARRRRVIASLEEAHAQREALEATTLVITKKSGDNGRLFGAVSSAEIAEVASAATGKDIDRRAVTVPSPIKSLGQHKATIKLHEDVVATVSITVEDVPAKKRK
ncbi:MAG: 50S ribosomal protein L9 [Ancrocorticia sp.]|jgi:large subunit ribosomal protein L9|nr:50S ribosomal protein L9 [Ancrocorticia sp.]MCI1932817.1 50S ribosomal protein L9 [Ancrocorticia sp.]MCI1963613.1 50S ribosomal protein L9 [Ancrocorticia sp.]MCI2012118.1 50S ribosomal protein L9 [Ancrocorticia sp.]MCI2029809.1 50S ribosomal protein L9 [Ancrocorticia sp.]